MFKQFSKEARAQKEFERGMSDLERGHEQAAQKRFNRAEKLGLNLQKAFEDTAGKELEAFKQTVRGEKRQPTLQEQRDNEAKGKNFVNTKKLEKLVTASAYSVGTPAPQVSAPVPDDRGLDSTSGDGGNGGTSQRYVTNVEWNADDGKLVITYSDGGESEIAFSDCPA